MKPRHRAALAAAALALVAPVSGCAALLSAQQTHEYRYNGGDGAWESFDGGIEARGVLLIANDDATEAQLFYTLVNNSAHSAEVEFKVGDFTDTVTVEAGQTLTQNPQDPTFEGDEKTVRNYNAVTGEQVDVDITVNRETKTVRTQVLDKDLWYYDGLAPDGSSTDAPSDEPSDGAEESETATPSEEPSDAEAGAANG